MSAHDDDAGDDLLAGVDLHAWQVPPPRVEDRPPILVRALAPAATKQPRLRWMFVALAIVNALIAALIVIIITPSAPRTIVAVPAGGGSLDAQVQDVLRRLESERRELERRLAEIEELRALIHELSERLRRYEDGDRRDRTVRDARDTTTPPAPSPAPGPSPAPSPAPVADDTSCDEVSCVLTNYDGTCCAKYKRPRPVPPPSGTPETLDRETISAGVASVKASVDACGAKTGATGKVKVRVVVAPSGVVSRLEVAAAPTVELGRCVAAAMRKAVFATTVQGGTFSYPFVF